MPYFAITRRRLGILLLCFWPILAFPAETRTPARTSAAQKNVGPDSKQLEMDLQRLNWKQFRWVVESIPPLKAGVDSYGPMGWQYVQAKYSTYPWKNSIDKLDASEKRQLADLLLKARKIR
jgi:hypothetical protein